MIKTVWSVNASKYDAMVNEAIQEGYKLKVRDIRDLAGQRGFYAELEKIDSAGVEEVVKMLRSIKEICENQTSCKDCPLDKYIGEYVCEGKEPVGWVLPE